MEEVKIRVTGHIDTSWQDWLGGLNISYSGVTQSLLGLFVTSPRFMVY